MRMGFSFSVQTEAGSPPKTVFSPAKNLLEPSGAEELRWMRRAWVEIQVHLAALTKTGEAQQPT
jgi:hypothetical protein